MLAQHSDGRYREYLGNMWIQLASNYFDRPIHILNVMGGQTVQINPLPMLDQNAQPIITQNNHEPLYVLFYEQNYFGLGGHYQSIRPQDAQSIDRSQVVATQKVTREALGSIPEESILMLPPNGHSSAQKDPSVSAVAAAVVATAATLSQQEQAEVQPENRKRSKRPHTPNSESSASVIESSLPKKNSREPSYLSKTNIIPNKRRRTIRKKD